MWSTSEISSPSQNNFKCLEFFHANIFSVFLPNGIAIAPRSVHVDFRHTFIAVPSAPLNTKHSKCNSEIHETKERQTTEIIKSYVCTEIYEFILRRTKNTSFRFGFTSTHSHTNCVWDLSSTNWEYGKKKNIGKNCQKSTRNFFTSSDNCRSVESVNGSVSHQNTNCLRTHTHTHTG